jgi:DNA primase
VDAIAITLATSGTHIGVAPLGTSLTDTQAAQLAAMHHAPIIATDADPAGRKAAERDYWQLAIQGANPTCADLPDGADPADLVATGKSDSLTSELAQARPLAEVLIDRLLQEGLGPEVILQSVRIIAAEPSANWDTAVIQIADRADLPAPIVRSALASAVRSWNSDPGAAACRASAQPNQVGDRLRHAQGKTPEQANYVRHPQPAPVVPESRDPRTRWV